jgi:ABC-type lipopolysaccharide export system ATPase subunit
MELQSVQSSIESIREASRAKQGELQNMATVEGTSATQYYESNIANSRAVRDSVKKEISSVEADLNKIGIRIDDKCKERDSIKTALNGGTYGSPICYTCGQPLQSQEAHTKLFNLLTSMVSEINVLKEDKDIIYGKLLGLKNDLDTHVLTIKTFESELLNKRKYISEWYAEQINILNSDTQDKQNAYKEKLININSAISNNKSNVKKLYDEELSLITSSNSIELQNLQNNYNSMVCDLRTEHSTINNEMLKNTSILDTIVTLKNSIAKIQQDCTTQSLIMNEHSNAFAAEGEAQKKTISSIMDDVKETEGLIEGCNAQIVKIEEELKAANFWVQAFSDTGIPNLVLDDAIPTLNEKARELSSLTNAIKISFDAQSATKAGDLRNKFRVHAVNTKALSVDDELSSGEQRLGNIIVMLCLRNLIEKSRGIKTNIILFDEALDSLDPENVNIVGSMLRALSKDYLVMLITHTFRDSLECNETIQLD